MGSYLGLITWLYDSGLLLIDSNYIVHISTLIQSTAYQQYNGQRIALPDNPNSYPSKKSLELKKQISGNEKYYT